MTTFEHDVIQLRSDFISSIDDRISSEVALAEASHKAVMAPTSHDLRRMGIKNSFAAITTDLARRGAIEERELAAIKHQEVHHRSSLLLRGAFLHYTENISAYNDLAVLDASKAGKPANFGKKEITERST
jgi:hypothetical protein